MWPATPPASGCISHYIPGHFQHGEKGTNSRAIQRLAIHCRNPQRKNQPMRGISTTGGNMLKDYAFVKTSIHTVGMTLKSAPLASITGISDASQACDKISARLRYGIIPRPGGDQPSECHIVACKNARGRDSWAVISDGI